MYTDQCIYNEDGSSNIESTHYIAENTTAITELVGIIQFGRGVGTMTADTVMAVPLFGPKTIINIF